METLSMFIAAVMVWLKFFAAVLLIGVAGSTLSRYGDAIAEKTGLSSTWIGIVLLATVTSLPELISGISAVALADAPDLAVGGVMGSCVFNLTIIALLDGLNRRESIYTQVSQEHILTTGFGVLLIGVAALSLLLPGQSRGPALGRVGLSSLVIVVLYVLTMRSTFRYGQRQASQAKPQADEPTQSRYAGVSMRQVVLRYSAAAVVVVAAGAWLPFLGEEIAAVMGWQETFIGTLFIALATSIPEVVVSLAALRLGALDMAFGNVLGSNLFNIATLPIDDLFFAQGPLLAHVSALHLISSQSAIMMTGLVTIGLLYRPRAWPRHTIAWTSWLLLILFVVNSYLVFRTGGQP